MKFQTIVSAIAALAAPMAVVAKSQDYARHIELSLLFYEAQRSGKLPENNRIYWRHDSMLDAGADNGVDLTGGYYDAGDNVKFNFPGAAALTLLAWSGIDYADGYKEADQWDYILDAVRWGADYFMKCHTGKNELYVQVGKGATDHGFWYPPEYIQYEHPSYKITAAAPGSEVAGDTASFLAAASILFKDEDPSYSSSLLKHAIEIYDFADKYRDTYTTGIPDAQGYYRSYSGFMDELVWGAAMLLLATGDESYRTKVDAIWDYPYSQYDPDYFLNSGGPISWDDKKACSYALMYMITGEDKYKEQAFQHSDLMVNYKTTPGGLWFDTNLSAWGSNRYASNAAYTVAMVASTMDASDSKRKQYVNFIQKQVDYIQGDNPAKVDYIVGADPSSPKAVHHRGSSGVFDSQDKAAKPDENIYPIWGALAGGPDENDKYVDTRSDFRSNEVALDYNAAFQMNLAFLTQEGLSKPDPDSVKNHERSYPKKAETPDIRLSFKDGEFSIATGSGMRCSGWCVSFESSSYSYIRTSDGNLIEGEKNTLCNKRENNALDGEGTAHIVTFQASGSDLPTEFTVMCDGFHAPLNHQKVSYVPEWGRKYKVVGGGGVGKTTPLFEETECWPAFICDKNATPPSQSTTVKPVETPVSNDDCFALDLGYKCCNNNSVEYTDESGDWGVIDGEWCGIGGSSSQKQPEPTPEPQPTCGDYPCCSGCDVVYTDNDGDWGVEEGNWCLIQKSTCGGSPQPQPETWTGQDSGYPKCNTCDVSYQDNDGPWGVENGEWCGISSNC